MALQTSAAAAHAETANSPSTSDPASPTILTPDASDSDSDSEEKAADPALGTPLSLLSARLERGFAPHFDVATQRALKPIACPQVSAAAGRLCARVGWQGGGMRGQADAAAILDAAAPRRVVEWETGRVVERFVADCQTTSGRVFDRLFNMEVQRLIPWSAGNATGLIFDALHGGVRRMLIQDARRWEDTERLDWEGKEMACTRDERGRDSSYVPIVDDEFVYLRQTGASLKCGFRVSEEEGVVLGGCQTM